jgi:hypothetical protein
VEESRGRKSWNSDLPVNLSKINRRRIIKHKPHLFLPLPGMTDFACPEHFFDWRHAVKWVLAGKPTESQRTRQATIDIDRRTAAPAYRAGMDKTLIGTLNQNRIPAAATGTAARVYIAHHVHNLHTELFNPGTPIFRQAIRLHTRPNLIDADIPGRVPNAFYSIWSHGLAGLTETSP